MKRETVLKATLSQEENYVKLHCPSRWEKRETVQEVGEEGDEMGGRGRLYLTLHCPRRTYT